MVNTSAILILVIVLFVSVAAGARTKLFSCNGQGGIFGSSKVAKDSICKSMVETQGYICQELTVTTKDGYILGIQRMPNARSGQPANKPPVLLQHGLFMDGTTWLLTSTKESLAFILADAGYDVWIANTRGTSNSLGHKSLSPNDQAYWEWSWDELVAYDLPAVVQFVHDHTGQKLHYVGHSLGTLMAFAALSQDKLVDMIRSIASLCPIAHLGNMESPLAKAASLAFLAEEMYWLGIYEFCPRGEPAVKLLDEICNQQDNNCSDIMDSFTGLNCCINSTTTGAFLRHGPQSSTTKNMVHLSQMARMGTVQMFDYGNIIENMNHYGQPTPPVYNMTSIPKDFPLFLSYGGRDWLSDVQDVKILLDNLDDHHRDKLVVKYIENYAHADFVFGMNAKQVVYDPMMAFFKLN